MSNPFEKYKGNKLGTWQFEETLKLHRKIMQQEMCKRGYLITVDPQIDIGDLIDSNETIRDYYKQFGQDIADSLIESHNKKKEETPEERYDRTMRGLV